MLDFSFPLLQNVVTKYLRMTLQAWDGVSHALVKYVNPQERQDQRGPNPIVCDLPTHVKQGSLLAGYK